MNILLFYLAISASFFFGFITCSLFVAGKTDNKQK